MVVRNRIPFGVPLPIWWNFHPRSVACHLSSGVIPGRAAQELFNFGGCHSNTHAIEILLGKLTLRRCCPQEQHTCCDENGEGDQSELQAISHRNTERPP